MMLIIIVNGSKLVNGLEADKEKALPFWGILLYNRESTGFCEF
jgi:hypothetical protein